VGTTHTHRQTGRQHAGLGGLRLLGYEVELGRHPAELRERPSIHLPHRVAAMDLHRSFGDAQVASDLFAKATRAT